MNTAAKIAQKHHDTTQILSNRIIEAVANYTQGQYAKTIRLSLSVVNNSKDSELLNDAYNYLVRSYSKLGQIDSAVYYMAQVRHNGTPQEQVSYYMSLAEIEKGRGDYKKAYEYNDLSEEIAESIVREASKMDLYRIEKQFDQAQHIKEKEQIRRSYLAWVVISTLSICLVITILIILWIRYTKERRAYKDFIEALKTQPSDTPLPDLLRTQEARFREAIEKRLSLIGELITLSYEYKDRDRAFIAKFNKLVAADPLNSEALNDIAEVVNNGYNGLIVYLKTTHPTLKDSELLICALTCVGFTSQQLFIILNAKSVETIYYQKNRINTKLGIHGDLRKNLLRMADQRGVKD